MENKISLTDVLTSKGSNIGIVHTMKQGCSSLTHLQEKFSDAFEIVEKDLTDKNFTFVIPIRGPYEKWVSGVIQELDVGGKEDVFKRWVDSDEQMEEILERFIRIGLSNIRKPMALYHSKLGRWTVNDEISLFQYTKMKNIYFVELKEFSNPNFIEWMRQRDKNWSVVDEIPKINVTNNSDWKQFAIKTIKKIISKSKGTDDIIFNIFYRQDEDYNFGNHYHKRNDFVAFEEILERYFFLEETIFEEIKKSDRFIELEPYEENINM